MKIKELKENEPLQIIEVSNHLTFHSTEIERNMIKMRVFTDGEIAKESEEKVEGINEYYFGKQKYQCNVDTLKTKNVYFKNHNYVITYLISQEWTRVGNICGWFDIIKDVSIYMKNPKDRKTLRTVKQVIRQNEERIRSVDYSSLLSMLAGQRKGFEAFEPEKISENVYNLKRVK